MNPRTVSRLVAALLLASCWLALPAWAHKASDAYLQLHRSGDALTLRWDIALRDLDAALDLDPNADRQLTWGEVKLRLADIEGYALTHLRLQQGRCTLKPAAPAAVERRIDGAYLVLTLRGACADAAALEVDYQLFREVDPTHRGLLRIDGGAGPEPSLRSLDPVAGPVTVAVPTVDGAPSFAQSSPPSATGPAVGSGASTTMEFFKDGVHHILIGYDHILFLICLLLPAVLVRTADGWRPVQRWRDAVWPVVAMVTLFTVGHSVTLALASLKLVSVAPGLIEPAIALTIAVAAYDNLRPFLFGRRRLFAFLFGLVHGFGFASVLGELDLPTTGFVAALLQFNLGVEAGQLVIVAIAMAILLALRHWRHYPLALLRVGSGLALVIALVWFVERVFDWKLLPV